MLNKEQFVAMVAKDNDKTKKSTRNELNMFIDGIKKAIRQHGGVKFSGFGEFEARKVVREKFTDPNTGETIYKSNDRFTPTWSPSKKFTV